jgi:hypothetical protein
MSFSTWSSNATTIAGSPIGWPGDGMMEKGRKEKCRKRKTSKIKISKAIDISDNAGVRVRVRVEKIFTSIYCRFHCF